MSLGILCPLTSNSVEVDGFRRAGPARRRTRTREGMKGGISRVRPEKALPSCLAEQRKAAGLFKRTELIVSKIFSLFVKSTAWAALQVEGRCCHRGDDVFPFAVLFQGFPPCSEMSLSELW